MKYQKKNPTFRICTWGFFGVLKPILRVPGAQEPSPTTPDFFYFSTSSGPGTLKIGFNTPKNSRVQILKINNFSPTLRICTRGFFGVLKPILRVPGPQEAPGVPGRGGPGGPAQPSPGGRRNGVSPLNPACDPRGGCIRRVRSLVKEVLKKSSPSPPAREYRRPPPFRRPQKSCALKS